MNRRVRPKVVVALVAVIVELVLFVLYRRRRRSARLSAFGRYRGYSEAGYDGSRRVSDYLTLSDGCDGYWSHPSIFVSRS